MAINAANHTPENPRKILATVLLDPLPLSYVGLGSGSCGTIVAASVAPVSRPDPCWARVMQGSSVSVRVRGGRGRGEMRVRVSV